MGHHLYPTIDYIDLVEMGVGDVGIDIQGVGIAAHLGLSLCDSLLNLCVRGLALQVFQFDNVGVLHIGKNLIQRTQENVGIAVLIVQLGDGAVEMALARQ